MCSLSTDEGEIEWPQQTEQKKDLEKTEFYFSLQKLLTKRWI